MTKEEIIKEIKNVKAIQGYNIMGCSENWYNPYYAIRETFTMEDYPIVKYRVVNGNGYTVCNTWNEVTERIEYLTTDPLFKDKKRFQPQYVIKVTEEYIEL